MERHRKAIKFLIIINKTFFNHFLNFRAFTDHKFCGIENADPKCHQVPEKCEKWEGILRRKITAWFTFHVYFYATFLCVYFYCVIHLNKMKINDNKGTLSKCSRNRRQSKRVWWFFSGQFMSWFVIPKAHRSARWEELLELSKHSRCCTLSLFLSLWDYEKVMQIIRDTRAHTHQPEKIMKK